MQAISEQTAERAGKAWALTVTGPFGQTNDIPAAQDFTMRCDRTQEAPENHSAIKNMKIKTKGEHARTTSHRPVKSLRARRKAAGLTTRGLPKGYRNNPALLAQLPDEPKRGISSRNPLNWLEKKCLFCRELIISNKRQQKFCSRHCRFSYEFQQKQRLPGVKG